MTTMRRTKKPCVVCGKPVIHVDGKPYASHVKGKPHREVERRAARARRASAESG